MAAAAEQLTYNYVETPDETGRWFDAATIPGLKALRTAAHERAATTLEARMQQLRDGDYEAVPFDVDPLTTANRALQARNDYGSGSPEAVMAQESLVVDCSRLFAEAYRKNTWEYFAPLEQVYDQDLGSYVFKGYALNEMVAGGLTPIAEPEEQTYRLQEAVEEATYVGIRQLGALALGNLVVLDPVKNLGENLTVITISQCADWAIKAHDHNPQASHGGYAPEIRKLMIRGVRYSSGSDSRWQEQVGVSGRYITEDVISDALQSFGVVSGQSATDKRAVRGTQLVGIEGQGVLDIVKKLDELASKRYGKTIFMGEVVADDTVRDYEQVPQLAAIRQAELDDSSRELSDYLLQLEADRVDHWQANLIVEAFVKKQLLAKVRNNPAAAAATFDHATAAGLQLVAQLQAAGNIAAAQQVMDRVERQAPAPSYCGAGSCGLEAVDSQSVSGKALAEKLKAGDNDKIVKDKERACKSCKTKSVVYAYNDHKVNKLCQKCGAFESKTTTAR